jgi:hypothetical protein
MVTFTLPLAPAGALINEVEEAILVC